MTFRKTSTRALDWDKLRAVNPDKYDPTGKLHLQPLGAGYHELHTKYFDICFGSGGKAVAYRDIRSGEEYIALEWPDTGGSSPIRVFFRSHWNKRIPVPMEDIANLLNRYMVVPQPPTKKG